MLLGYHGKEEHIFLSLKLLLKCDQSMEIDASADCEMNAKNDVKSQN
jgi:hypothetical protein